MNSAETKTIEVTVNGQMKRIGAGSNIVQLLAQLGIEGSRVAVELNREIVRQPAWESTVIAEGAKIEVVWFVGGGAR